MLQTLLNLYAMDFDMAYFNSAFLLVVQMQTPMCIVSLMPLGGGQLVMTVTLSLRFLSGSAITLRKGMELPILSFRYSWFAAVDDGPPNSPSPTKLLSNDWPLREWCIGIPCG